MSKLRFVDIFGVFMPLFYLVIAVALAFTHLFAAWVQGTAAYIFAGIFFLYALFRIYRLFRHKE